MRNFPVVEPNEIVDLGTLATIFFSQFSLGAAATLCNEVRANNKLQFTVADVSTQNVENNCYYCCRRCGTHTPMQSTTTQKPHTRADKSDDSADMESVIPVK